jgi:hypothetical protein
MSVSGVAEQLLCSPSKISRMETAQRNVSLRDVRDLCNLYGITDEGVRQQLMDLARGSRASAWWQEYNLSPALERMVGLEGSASQISDFQPSVVPGLLQTNEYARAVLEVWIQDPVALKLAVDARMMRQESLSENTSLRAVVDESAVRRMVGGSSVMRGQLGRLVELGRLPRVDLRVIPFDTGAHQGVVGGFVVLQFAKTGNSGLAATMPDVVYREDLGDGTYLEEPTEVERYLRAFDALQTIASTTATTARLLESLLREM